MTDELETPNPDGAQESGEIPTDYVERRAAELRASRKKETPVEEESEAETVEEEAQESEAEEAEEAQAEEAEAEEGEEAEDEGNDEIVLSQVDYETLDKDGAEELGRILAERLGDNIAAFSRGAGSGLGHDMGKLRGKNRDLEAENKKLKEGLERVSPNVNIFADITDEAELDQKEKGLIQNYDYYEDIAIQGNWEINDEGDEGVFDQGKFFPKEQMRKILNQWKGELRAIPQRRAQLDKRKAVSKQRDKTAKVLAEKLDWFGDKETEQSKSYSDFLADASVASAIHLFPDLEPKLMEAFAYSIEGQSGRKRKIKIPLTNKPKPSGGGDNGARGSGRGKSRGLAAAEQRMANGQGSEEDYILTNSQKYKKFFKSKS
jgi:flagellar motor protein MotB